MDKKDVYKRQTGAISSASQKAVIFHQADGSTTTRKADSNGKVTLPAIKNEMCIRDSGYGAGYLATQINRLAAGTDEKGN